MVWVPLGELHTQVVGCNHYGAHKPRSKGAALLCRRDPDNPYDANAIEVHAGEIGGASTHIGYVPADVAKLVRGRLAGLHARADAGRAASPHACPARRAGAQHFCTLG